MDQTVAIVAARCGLTEREVETAIRTADSADSVYAGLARCFLARGAVPRIGKLDAASDALVPAVRDGVDELLWRRGSGFVQRALARGLVAADREFFVRWGNALLAGGQSLHALRMYWAVAEQHDPVEPGLARRIMEAWFRVEHPTRALQWLSRCGLPPTQEQAIAGDLEQLRTQQLRAQRECLSANLTHLAKAFPDLARALALAQPTGAECVWLRDEPWEIHATHQQAPVQRGDYPLLLRVEPQSLRELNPPDPPGALLHALRGVSDVMWGHACVGSLTRYDALVNLVRNRLTSKVPGRGQVVYGVAEDVALLRRFAEVEDLRSLLRPDRIELFWGRGAQTRVIEHFRRHAGRPVPQLVAGASAELRGGLQAVMRERLAQANRCAEVVLDRYTPDFGQTVLDKLDRGQPLRVWCLSSRHTTVLQHVAHDLGEGFRALGHRFDLLIEDDARDLVDKRALYASLADCRPDLAVILDHIRPEYAGALCPELPCASWILDEMPQLRDPDLVRQLGPLDLTFAWSPWLARTFAKLGYPHTAVLPFATNPGRYDAAGPSPAPEASVAFATHLALPADEVFAVGFSQRLMEVVEALPRIPSGTRELAPWVDQVVDELGLTLPPGGVDKLHYSAIAVARHVDRLRVADAVVGAGLPLACYGRGWDAIERFAPFARGVVTPGEPLRQMYQRHKVVLHVNHRCNLHLRVLESISAGGFVLARSDGEFDYAPGGLAEHLAPGREICLFRDLDDLVVKARRAFDDASWRAGFVEAGRARVLAAHTYRHRAEAVVKELRAALAAAHAAGRRAI